MPTSLPCFHRSSLTAPDRIRIATRVIGALMGLILATRAFANAPVAQPLDDGWQFRLLSGDAAAKSHPDATRWRAAQVPGSVQTDLLAAGAIVDPFVGTHEAQLQWIGVADWQYRRTLDVDAATLQRDHVELVFDGLDTFADVRVNGHGVLAADNMFRRWRVPVKSALHAGHNTIEVDVHSPVARLLPWLLKQPQALPGEFDSAFGDEPPGKQTSNYVRKANYQYGWDWGPRYLTAGIWRPVRLESWDAVRLDDVHVAQQSLDDARAQLEARFAVQADKPLAATLYVHWRGPDGREGDASRKVDIPAGERTVALPLAIDRPQRWWPNGYGAPNLYDVHAEIAVGGTTIGQVDRRIGLRTIELRRERDRFGRGFAFVVNSVPVFAKGANLIPFDSFPNRVTPAQMERVLSAARDTHMNMLRVWGGGYYLDDAFYGLADRMGLLLWQDFMFGGAVPPADTAFHANVKQEAIEQVRRLRDHPSIALWCGNNEVQTGWEAWPDRKTFRDAAGPAETARIEAGMRTLFGQVLREVVRSESPQTPYWSSSPSTDGEGKANVPDDGDVHYWDVWSGDAKPVEAYLESTPRFQSEYGLQSMPVMATVRAFAGDGPLAAESPVLRAHQKYDKGNGNARLLKYVRRGYGEPKDFPSFVYLTQVMQAEGIELAVDHLRGARPRTMGSLYWQLNDVWPGASWSSIDWYGRWKALQFHARRFYAPVRVAPIHHDGRTELALVSDRTTPLAATLRTRVLDMDGRTRYVHDAPVSLPALSSTRLPDLADTELLHGGDPRRSVAVFELIANGQRLSRQTSYFDHAVALALPDPGLTTRWTRAPDGLDLIVSAKRLAREVWIDFGDLDADLSDNAFDVLPGESVTLHVRSRSEPAALARALDVRSLAGSVAPAAAPGSSPASSGTP